MYINLWKLTPVYRNGNQRHTSVERDGLGQQIREKTKVTIVCQVEGAKQISLKIILARVVVVLHVVINLVEGSPYVYSGLQICWRRRRVLQVCQIYHGIALILAREDSFRSNMVADICNLFQILDHSPVCHST